MKTGLVRGTSARGHALLGVLLAVSCALVVACSSDGPTDPGGAEPQPRPGQLSVTISSSGPVGAVVLRVTGPSIGSPVAAGGADLYHHLTGDTLRAALVGTTLSGEVLRFSVADLDQAAGYSVTVEQAAGNDDATVSASTVSATVSTAPAP